MPGWRIGSTLNLHSSSGTMSFCAIHPLWRLSRATVDGLSAKWFRNQHATFWTKQKVIACSFSPAWRILFKENASSTELATQCYFCCRYFTVGFECRSPFRLLRVNDGGGSQCFSILLYTPSCGGQSAYIRNDRTIAVKTNQRDDEFDRLITHKFLLPDGAWTLSQSLLLPGSRGLVHDETIKFRTVRHCNKQESPWISVSGGFSKISTETHKTKPN